MRKADKIKLSIIVGVSLLAFIVGCVDTSVQPIPTSIDFYSDINVVNLTVGTGADTVRVYSAKVNQDSLAAGVLLNTIDYMNPVMSGTLALGSALPGSDTYKQLPAGGKAIIVTYQNIGYKDTLRFSSDSQYKMRIFIVGDTSKGGRDYVKATERYIWQTPGSSEGAQLFPSGSGWLKVFNGCPDSSVSVDVQSAKTDSSYFTSDPDYSTLRPVAGSA